MIYFCILLSFKCLSFWRSYIYNLVVPCLPLMALLCNLVSNTSRQQVFPTEPFGTSFHSKASGPLRRGCFLWRFTVRRDGSASSWFSEPDLPQRDQLILKFTWSSAGCGPGCEILVYTLMFLAPGVLDQSPTQLWSSNNGLEIVQHKLTVTTFNNLSL